MTMNNHVVVTKGCYTDLKGLSTEDRLRVLKAYKDAGFDYINIYEDDADFVRHVSGCDYLTVINEPLENNCLRLALLTREELDSERYFLGFSAKRISAKDVLESTMTERKKRVYAEATCDGFGYIKTGDRVLVSYDDGEYFNFFLHEDDVEHSGIWKDCPHLEGGDWKRIEIYEGEHSEEAVIPLTKNGDSIGVSTQTEPQCLLIRIKQAKMKFDEAEKEFLEVLKEADEVLEGTGLQLDIY